MQHHAPRSSCVFQQNQNDMKINIAYLWKEEVIFQTTKLGTGCVSSQRHNKVSSLVFSGLPDFEKISHWDNLPTSITHQPPFPNHFVKLFPVPAAQSVTVSPKLSPPLCSSVWLPPTRQRDRKSHKMLPFQRKICHLDLETEFHEDWVYCTKLKSDGRSNLKLKIPSNHSIQIPMAKIPPVHRITSAYNVCVIMCMYTYLVYMHVEKGFVTSSSFHPESPIAIYTCIGHICTLISTNLIFWSLPRIFRNIRILGRTNLDLTQPLPIFELSPANLRAPSMVSRCA